jgi:hypothetical protein
MLDSDCFGSKNATNVLTEGDVAFMLELMERQRDGGTLGPALDVIIPAVTRQQIAEGPAEANRLANEFLFTDTTPLNDNPNEAIKRKSMRSTMKGNASSDKHDPDADALFETAKYECDVFVSNDSRLRKTANSLGIPVLSLPEMMQAIRSDSWPTNPGA